MKLRPKTILALAVVFGAYTAAVYVVHQTIVYPSFQSLEEEEAREDIERGLQSLQREIDHLAVRVSDWAVWDDTYDFVVDQNSEYIASNLTPDTYDKSALDLVVIVDATGRLRHADAATSSELPELFRQERLPADTALLEGRRAAASGLFSIEGQVFMLAMHPILRTNLDGPSRGLVILGRALTPARIRALSRITQVDLEAFAPDAEELGLSSTELEGLANRSLVRAIDSGACEAITLLTDINDEPIMVIRAVVDRNITQTGASASRVATLSLFGVSLLVMCLAVIWLNRTVISRVEDFDRFVQGVGAEGDVSKRIQVSGRDELGELGHNLNAMLEHLDQVNRELDEAVAAAEEAADSRSRFLARMSHEIRTPMNGILGMIGLLMDTPLRESQREFAEAVEDSAASLLTIMNDVLDFSKLEADKLALHSVPTDLAGLVQRIVRVMKPLADERGLEIRYSVDPEIPSRVEVDPTRLRQVLTNLIHNAVKFTSEGEVAVLVELNRELSGAVVVDFEVSDTGVGISEGHLPFLFESFYQAETPRWEGSGTGLGLAISRQLLDLMGSSIEVTSSEGMGSRFSFSLEVRLSSTATFVGGSRTVEAHDPADFADEWRTQVRLLVVDDDEVSRRVASIWLRKAGYQVETASDGEIALDRMASGNFQLVLMDTQMPNLDGFETTRAIRRWSGPAGATPIIAVTASVLKGSREACIEAGMNDFMTKPVDPQHLVWLVEQYVWPLDEAEDTSPDNGSVPPIRTPVPKPKSQNSTSPDPIDIPQAIARMEDAALWRELVVVFQQTTRQRIGQIREALTARNLTDVREHAHAIKGSSALMGADNVTEAARALEEAGFDADRGAQMLNQLCLEMERVDNQLARYLGSVDSGLEALE